MAARPKSNGALVNYRLDKVEDVQVSMGRLLEKHDERLNNLEKDEIRRAGGITVKQLGFALVMFLTIVSLSVGIFVQILK